MGICSICQTDFFSFQIWRWRRCDCGGSDMAPIWSWLSCSISLNCHKYFSDTSNIFVPMWLLGSRLGADMIATWRRYDSATYCQALLHGADMIGTLRVKTANIAKYGKFTRFWFCFVYTHCIEHCRLINIILLKCLMQSISTENFDLMRIRCKAKNGFIL